MNTTRIIEEHNPHVHRRIVRNSGLVAFIVDHRHRTQA